MSNHYYRKRPKRVEARQLTTANADELARWCDGKVNLTKKWGVRLVFTTAAGDLIKLHRGDWLVKGPHHNDFYPVEDDIFQDLFYKEPVKAKKESK